MSRSPNYPSMPLPNAVACVISLWKEKGRATMTAEEVVQAMGYKGLSGISRSYLSALKKYGLVEAKGSGWSLSARAIVLAVKDATDPDYQRAIREAIYDVELFRELLEQHVDSSPRLLQNFLITERDFTEDGARRASEAFFQTKSMIPAGSGRAMSEGTEANWPIDVLEVPAPPPAGSMKTTMQGNTTQLESMMGGPRTATINAMRPHTVELPPGTKTETFSLENGEITVRWPAAMTAEDFANVTDWLPILKRKLGKSVQPPMPASPPANDEDERAAEAR